jgi:hypothetical protein
VFVTDSHFHPSLIVEESLSTVLSVYPLVWAPTLLENRLGW